MMTSVVPRLPVTPAPAARAQSAPPEVVTSGLAVRLWRPTSTAVVAHVAGELDASSAPYLQKLLAPRLSSTLETVVLDLSELDFMGVVGLQLLASVQRHAASRSMTVRLVDGPVCVHRALRAAGWLGTVPTYSTVTAAVADLSGRAREHPPTSAEPALR